MEKITGLVEFPLTKGEPELTIKKEYSLGRA